MAILIRANLTSKVIGRVPQLTWIVRHRPRSCVLDFRITVPADWCENGIRSVAKSIHQDVAREHCSQNIAIYVAPVFRAGTRCERIEKAAHERDPSAEATATNVTMTFQMSAGTSSVRISPRRYRPNVSAMIRETPDEGG